MHFFQKKFAYIKKLLYLCTGFQKEPNYLFYTIMIRLKSQITFFNK